MAAKPTPEAMLDAILSRVPALRAAGVSELSVGGVSLKLAAPVVVDPLPVASVTAQDVSAPALDDPESYGLPPGSQVPGFKHRRRNEEP